MSIERKAGFDPELEAKLQEAPASGNDKKKEEMLGVCAASKKDRRKCPTVTPSYESCHNCPYTGIKEGDINLGDKNLRGGIETSQDSAAWRKEKLIHGIPHGDD